MWRSAAALPLKPAVAPLSRGGARHSDAHHIGGSGSIERHLWSSFRPPQPLPPGTHACLDAGALPSSSTPTPSPLLILSPVQAAWHAHGPCEVHPLATPPRAAGCSAAFGGGATLFALRRAPVRRGPRGQRPFPGGRRAAGGTRGRRGPRRVLPEIRPGTAAPLEQPRRRQGRRRPRRRPRRRGLLCRRYRRRPRAPRRPGTPSRAPRTPFAGGLR